MSPLPAWLKKPIPKRSNIDRLRELLDDKTIHTVCESAKCPNVGECFACNTVTFMILGEVCTRHCAFCGVTQGKPSPVDPLEPEKIAQAVKKLGLNYVVVTSVTRDDLPDGGAGQFGKVIQAIQAIEGFKVEVLIPDNLDLDKVIAARPYAINHNVETVPRLYPEIRPQADYPRSLTLLKAIKESDRRIYTKSGFMVGLGESDEEVERVLRDLRSADCDMVTIGQYLSPSRHHRPPERYVAPEEFDKYASFGEKLGLKMLSGPFVRSSYHAGDQIK